MTSRARATGATPLLERTTRLPSEPTSAGAARRVLRDSITTTGHDHWLDAAELAVSEIVTNAVLHAHSEIELRVVVFDDAMCVEVRDFSPVLPVPRDYEDEATTGRGMGLVALLSSACGVDALGDEGKIVWFALDESAADAFDESALLDAWDIDDWSPEAPTGDGCVEVVLVGLPPTLWLSARQHHDAILRELVLHLAAIGDDTVDVAAADWARSMISTRVVAAVEAAQARGTARPAVPAGHPSPLPWVPDDLDLRVPVPASRATDFGILQDVLDLAESLAVDGTLFTRPALPEVIAVRDWACDQVIAQVGGAPPHPWAGAAQAQFEVQVHGRPFDDSGFDLAAIDDATASVVAVDEANRIVAASDPLCAIVGWNREELVGRRVVTLVPPQFREAHVAGFSRHLTTGEAHVLGVPLDLPVLRRDGTTVECRLLIEKIDTRGGGVYVASIDPVPLD